MNIKEHTEINGIKPGPVHFSRDHKSREDFIITLIDNRDKHNLAQYLKDMYPADIAGVLSKCSFDGGMFIIRFLDPDLSGEVLHALEDKLQKEFLKNLSDVELAGIIREQESDNAVHLLTHLDSKKLNSVLSRIPSAHKIKITELLSYPENTAGSIMSKEFVFIHEDNTIKHAMQLIRKNSKATVDFYTVYVLDDDRKFRGHISLKKLILANPRTKIKKIMEKNLLPIPVSMDQEEVANFFTKYDFITAPVVDERGTMLGRITADDVMEVMEEEASEDILRMGGHISGDETLTTPLIESSQKRILWLCLNLITALMAAFVVNYFKNTISRIVILAALMPIVTSMGGNAAGQTVAIIVRNIALGELNFSNARKAMLREIILGLLNGFFMGLLTGIVVYFVSWGQHEWKEAAVLGIIMALALIINMMVAAISGAFIPLFLKRLGIDPAIASSIFVTTLTDVLGFFVFLGMATIAILFGLFST